VITMLPIKIFYHVYIPPDIRASMYVWYIDQQLQLIKQSGLQQLATVHMCVTMPAWWTSIFGTPIVSNTTRQLICFQDKLTEYVQTRYPWVTIEQVLDISQNTFEGNTLQQLWHYSQHEDFLALYIHTKGWNSQSECVSAWRELLNYWHIQQWCYMIKYLNKYDVVGINDVLTHDKQMLSGNFFWTTSKYVRLLADPQNIPAYTPDPSHLPGADHHRFAYELWILSNHPQVHYVLDLNIQPYDQYCFVEDNCQSPCNIASS